MYFKTVKRVLDQAIGDYQRVTGKELDEIDLEIAKQIVKTASEHQNPDPDINYDEPLCRLGYLFVHAAANGYLFERTIRNSSSLRDLVRSRTGNEFAVCAVGGGPGTELLGLVRYLAQPTRLTTPGAPKKLSFTVLDRIPQWGETWRHVRADM